jgi:probable rRNA maturation factor
MIEVEVFDLQAAAPGLPPVAEVRRLCLLAAASAGVHDGHLAVEFVDAERIAELNARYRNDPNPTDVLSFPIDGVGPGPVIRPGGGAADAVAGGQPRLAASAADRALGAIGPGGRELGDVVICPEHTVDIREAIVHGVLHLVGMDHETDGGEMLALQDRLLAREDL